METNGNGKKEPKHREYCVCGTTANMQHPFPHILTTLEYKLQEGTDICVLFTDVTRTPKSVLKTRQALSKSSTTKSHLVKQV